MKKILPITDLKIGDVIESLLLKNSITNETITSLDTNEYIGNGVVKNTYSDSIDFENDYSVFNTEYAYWVAIIHRKK